MRRDLEQRIEALTCYMEHRDEQQMELAKNEDWMVRLLLWMRRIVQRTFFTAWVWELKYRTAHGLP